MFLLVLAHPGSPGQRAIKRLLLCVLSIINIMSFLPHVFLGNTQLWLGAEVEI